MDAAVAAPPQSLEGEQPSDSKSPQSKAAAPSEADAAPLLVGADECELRLLLVTGDSFRLVQPADATVRQLKERVVKDPPSELLDFLSSSAPPGAPPQEVKVDEIRLLHLGKLLEDAKTLKECKMHVGPGSTTTVHISCRIPSNAFEDPKEKPNKKTRSSCCTLV